MRSWTVASRVSMSVVLWNIVLTCFHFKVTVLLIEWKVGKVVVANKGNIVLGTQLDTPLLGPNLHVTVRYKIGRRTNAQCITEHYGGLPEVGVRGQLDGGVPETGGSHASLSLSDVVQTLDAEITPFSAQSHVHVEKLNCGFVTSLVQIEI